MSGVLGNRRFDTGEPITADDVAERIDKAALRLLRLLVEARDKGLVRDVKRSHNLTNSVDLVADALDEFL